LSSAEQQPENDLNEINSTEVNDNIEEVTTSTVEDTTIKDAVNLME
jgi:hypothetical protein